MRNDSDDDDEEEEQEQEDMEVDDDEVLDAGFVLGPLQAAGVALKSVSVFDEVFARLKL